VLAAAVARTPFQKDVALAKKLVELYLDAGDAHSAYAQYQKLQKPDPKLLFMIAERLYRSGEHPKALGLLREVLRADAGHVQANIYCGNLRKERGELAEAERCFMAALRSPRLTPERAAHVCNQLALLYLRWNSRPHEQARLAQAEELIQRALAQDAGFYHAHHTQGMLFERRDQPEQAQESYRLFLAACTPADIAAMSDSTPLFDNVRARVGPAPA
jgi:lipopolysaccharide biosynthesis regulator YciM